MTFPALPFAPHLDAADVAGFVCVFVRAAAFFTAAPLLGEKQLPPRIRVTAAALCAFAVAPVRGPLDPARLPIVLPSDIFLGLAAGFVGRVVMAGIEAGGEIIGLSLGLGFAASYDPLLQAQAVPTQRIAVMLGGLAFLSAGGVEAGVRVIAGPPVDALTLATVVSSILHHAGEIMVVGLRFAAPLVVATTVANLAVALAARAAPAINVFSVMLALVVMLGGAVLYATAPNLVRECLGGGRRAAEAMQEAAR